MATLTIRDLSDATHRALRIQAAGHGRSMEAEVRAILTAAVAPAATPLGTRLHTAARALGLTDDDADMVIAARDRRPAEVLEIP
jgi:antitoxin FitA